jgi:PhnB protein
MPVSPVPAGYHTLTPYLIVDGAVRALDWYGRAFGAREVMRLAAPGDWVGHAEIEIGDSRVMLADEAPEHNAKAPGAFGGSPVSLHLYVPDVDATIAKAIDPFGHTWHISTHIEDVTEDEIMRRMTAISAKA